jgi:hypothetical protein
LERSRENGLGHMRAWKYVVVDIRTRRPKGEEKEDMKIGPLRSM